MLRRALFVLACALLVPIVPFVLIGELPGERFLSASEHDVWRFGSSAAALLALDLLLPVPSSIVGSLLGARLGALQGFAFAWSGMCVGQAIGYALGRLLPERFAADVPALPSAALVFLSRPVPVFAEAIALAAGVMRMPVGAYAGSMALGNAVYAAAMAASGATLLPQNLAGPGLLVPMLVPVAAYALYRRFVSS